MLEKLFAIFDRLKKENWATIDGLIVYSIAIFIACIVITGCLKALGVGNALRAIGIPVNIWWILTLILLLEATNFLIWKIKRSGFYMSEKILIVLAIKTGNESNDYIKEIKKNIKRQLASQKLNEIIHVEQLPHDIEFITSKQSEDYIKANEINFMLWGDTTEATRDGSKITVFNLNISYLFSALLPKQAAALKMNINQALNSTPWVEINQMNSITGIQVTSNNIYEIGLFTVGVCLVTVPNVKYQLASVNIFEQLRKTLKTKGANQIFPQPRFVLKKVESLLIALYVNLSFYFGVNDRNFKKGIEYAEKALAIDPTNFSAHINLANFYWKIDKQPLSRQHTKAALKTNPSSNMVRLNRIFYRFFDSNYSGGLRLLKKLKDMENMRALDICEFVEDEYEKYPEKMGLLFLYSWFSINFGDEDRGKVKMKEFIMQAKRESGYDELFTEAEKIS